MKLKKKKKEYADMPIIIKDNSAISLKLWDILHSLSEELSRIN